MNQHLLLIEDTEDLGEMIREVLLMAGFKVSWTKDGQAGLQIFAERNFDLVITDVVMPHVSGLEVVRWIRSNGYNSKIPIIIFSARSSFEDQRLGMEAGASLYLKKPCSNSMLVNSVKLLLKLHEERN